MTSKWTIVLGGMLSVFGALPASGADKISPPTDGARDIVVTDRAVAFDQSGRVPDVQLAVMRGGMRLPNGFDVSIGIDIQTRVDGILVLHTIYASDGPITGVRVYTDGSDAPRFAPGTVVVTTSNASAPLIATSRSPSGTTISAGSPTDSSTVNLVNGPEATWLTAIGQTEVPVSLDGASVTTGPGTFMLSSGSNGATSQLTTDDLQIQHLIGQATGVVIANVANNRAIDTVSSVNIDLANVAPLVASSVFSSQALALDIVRGR